MGTDGKRPERKADLNWDSGLYNQSPALNYGGRLLVSLTKQAGGKVGTCVNSWPP